MYTSPYPVVGMGATMPVGSDRYPYTVTRVSDNGKTVWAKMDNFKAGPGHNYFGAQNWVFEPNQEAAEECFTVRKDGRYVKLGESMKTGSRISIGHRSAYQDPSF